MKFCDKIEQLRKRKGLSQEELANELEVSRQSVFKWESGENTPDLDKIKKIAKLFNISLDTLLDDEVDLEDNNNIATQTKVKENKQTIVFRKTFDSGKKLNASEQANFEHGYPNGKKKMLAYSYEEATKEHTLSIAKKKYSKIIRIQHDILVDFFIDEINKTFGFFYDGAPQFLCPFENLLSFNITNSGQFIGHTSAPVVGVGIGKNPSFGVGSMPLNQTRMPSRYQVSISYFTESQFIKNYTISFSCNRMYITYDGTANDVDELYLWENSLSRLTNDKLSEMAACLGGIKEVGSRIKDGFIKVPPINFDEAKKEVESGQQKKQIILNNYQDETTVYEKKKKKAWLIALIVVATLVVGGITTCSINNAVKKNQIALVNRNKAQEVMDLIDAIGEVTLSSGPAITAAEKAFSALTPEQKTLVTNYDVLIKARNDYEKLLDDQREEETKNDPTRTITVSDLNGRWESSKREIMIGNVNGGTAVLYWWTGCMGGMISGTMKNSYLVGYNNKTRRMEIKLSCYSYLGYCEYADATMTKSSSGTLTLYYGGQTYSKISNS